MSVRKSFFESLEVRQLLASAAEFVTQQISFEGQTAPAVSGHWIVQLGGYDGSSGSQLKKARRLLGEQDANVFVRQYLVSDGLFSVRVPRGISVDQQFAMLQHMPGFVSADPDWIQTADLTPNDPSYGSLTGLNQSNDQDIDAPEAWNTSTGSMSQVVGIVDSGVDYDHPDLVQNIFLNQAEIPATRLVNLTDIDGDGLITFRDLNNAANQGVGKIQDQNADGRISGADLRAAMNKSSGVDNGTGGWADSIDTDGNGFADDLVGWNFLSDNNDPMDVFGHGSHVAGTVGAVGNNSVGVVGVNWKVRLMPLKTGGLTSSDNTINTSAAIAALNYAVLMKNQGNSVRVTNNSWGGGGVNPSLEGAIQANSDNDILFVAAAGNDGTNNDTSPHYPSSYTVPNVVSVANLTGTGARNAGSNFGVTSVDIGAPGTNILSTTGGSYAFFTGTSMASPHVAGVAALLLSVSPSLSVAQLKSVMFNNVDPITSLNGVVATGGRVNANKALGSLSLVTPSVPDLDAASDSGPSSTDNVTNDTTPTFSGTSSAGATVRIFVNGIQRGQSTANGSGQWSITSTALAAGTYQVTAATTNGISNSSASDPIQLTIDTTAPTASNGSFESRTAPQRALVQFSENMTNAFLPSHVTLTNLTTGQLIQNSNFATSFDTTASKGVVTFPGFGFGALPNGNYQASILAADLAGNPMASPYVFAFGFLNGDTEPDRDVDLNDFTRLAANFGQTDRVYSQGEFTYDGVVDLDDFTVLAANFGKTLPLPGDLPRTSGAAAGTFSNIQWVDSITVDLFPEATPVA